VLLLLMLPLPWKPRSEALAESSCRGLWETLPFCPRAAYRPLSGLPTPPLPLPSLLDDC